EYPDLVQQIVEVERLRDDVLDVPLLEFRLELRRGGAHEQDRHVAYLGVRADPIEDLETVEARHHDVEDEEVGVHLTDGLEDEGAVRDHHGLISILIVDRVAKQRRDRLVVLSDHDDLLLEVVWHEHRAIYLNGVEAATA